MLCARGLQFECPPWHRANSWVSAEPPVQYRHEISVTSQLKFKFFSICRLTRQAVYVIITTIIIIIIIIFFFFFLLFLHGLGRLTCFRIDALSSFPGASTIASSSRCVVEGVFRQSGVVRSFKVVDPGLFVFESHVLYSGDL